jgi:hypothetical protein
MEGQPQEPRPPETKEVNVNVAGTFVGLILFIALVWSMYTGEMSFAYLNAGLLATLAIANHVVNMMYK